MRWLDSITDSMNMNLSKLQKTVEDKGAWHAAVFGVAESDIIQQLSNNKNSNAKYAGCFVLFFFFLNGKPLFLELCFKQLEDLSSLKLMSLSLTHGPYELWIFHFSLSQTQKERSASIQDIVVLMAKGTFNRYRNDSSPLFQCSIIIFALISLAKASHVTKPDFDGMGPLISPLENVPQNNRPQVDTRCPWWLRG